MKNIIIFISILNVLLLFMHEFDAIHRQEWKMFKFLGSFTPVTQYYIFLYAHIPITLFLFYYLWSVINFSQYNLFIAVNAFGVFHLILHLFALKWKSNVFKSLNSLLFVWGIGITGIINLGLSSYFF